MRRGHLYFPWTAHRECPAIYPRVIQMARPSSPHRVAFLLTQRLYFIDGEMKLHPLQEALSSIGAVHADLCIPGKL